MLRRLALFAIIAVVTSTIIFPTSWAGAQKRAALVIGNSEYKNTGQLANPGNDAADIAEKLKQLGFEVVEGRDLSKVEMDRTIRHFADSLAGAQTALFFYAGHGLQVNGQNYLVPTDAKLTTAAALDFEMIRLDLIQRAMEREANSNILILDACRDNPLARNLARALGTRSAGIGRGLAAMESGEGTLISFSTQPGNVALDGSGRNSPFASALLKHIDTPGEDLPSILIKVRNDVMEATARRQVPWEHSALTAKFFFTAPKPTASNVPTVDQQIEFTFWASVKDSSNPNVLATYLGRYPEGEFANIARALIQHYEQRQRAEQAERDAEAKRQDEEKKAAEVTRLKEEQRASENAAETQQEAAALKQQLQKALADAAVAREAAGKAEAERLAAVKAAEAAKSEAEAAISAKRNASKSDAVKSEAIPEIKEVAPAVQKKPNPNSYSRKIWSSGDVKTGATVSAETPHGRLTCVGGSKKLKTQRSCRWD